MSRAQALGLALGALATTPGAWALEFEFGPGMSLDLKNRFTLGAAWRTQDRNQALIGKINLNPRLCDGDDCRDFGGDTAPNQRLVDAPGGLAAHNQDNGNLNYDQGDMVFATAKLASELTFKWGEFTAFIKGEGIYDEVNTGFTDKHPDTRFQPARTPRKQAIEDQVGQRVDILDAFVSYPLEIAGRKVHFTLGEQRIRWGEANTIQLNSIGEINPPDQNLLYFPGVELADIFRPVGLFTIATDLTETLALEMIYQYRWEPIRPAAAGSFLSISDIAGGGDYAVISEGQFSEDPEFIGTPQGTVSLISSSGSSVGFLPDNRPSDGGQYGISLRGFLPEFNNGTEWGIYYLKYHSRLPYGSVVSTDASCWRDSTNVAEALVDCRGFNGSGGTYQLPVTNTPFTPPPLDLVPLPNEAIDPVVDSTGVDCHRPRRRNTTINPTGQGCDPVTLDTLGVFLDYPENIHLYGLSFNTTIGLWSLAGEYSYRPNLPAQVQLQDVVFAGVNPVFPRQEIFIPGVATIPTASTTAPNYLETRYRGNPEIQPNTVIRGYERLKVGQLSLTGIRIFPSSNLFAADQILMLVEAGFTQVYNLPELDQLQFDGGSANATHFSPGADGSGGGEQDSRRIVPTMQTDDFADDFAWGYRVLVRAEYNAVFEWAPVIRPLLAVFHDVRGVSISPMQNFIEGRRQFVAGLQFEFTQDFSAQALYQWFTGGGALNKLSDRDYAGFNIAYSF